MYDDEYNISSDTWMTHVLKTKLNSQERQYSYKQPTDQQPHNTQSHKLLQLTQTWTTHTLKCKFFFCEINNKRNRV